MDVHPTKNGINRYWSIAIFTIQFLELTTSRRTCECRGRRSAIRQEAATAEDLEKMLHWIGLKEHLQENHGFYH